MRLVVPSVTYRKSCIAALREMQAIGEHTQDDAAQLDATFTSFVKHLRDESRGIGVGRGRVPQSTYWLVDRGVWIGRVSIRHRLNARLRRAGGHIGYEIRPSKRRKGFGRIALGLALPFARKLGLRNVLLTCDANNVGSYKIIEHWGGKLKNVVTVEGKKKRRYWVRLQ